MDNHYITMNESNCSSTGNNINATSHGSKKSSNDSNSNNAGKKKSNLNGINKSSISSKNNTNNHKPIIIQETLFAATIRNGENELIVKYMCKKNQELRMITHKDDNVIYLFDIDSNLKKVPNTLKRVYSSEWHLIQEKQENIL
jgi:hypothetical protein